jgi:hypothetical protein
MEELLLSAVELHGVNDVRHTEIHTDEPVVPEPCCVEVEIAIEKIKIAILTRFGIRNNDKAM